MRVGTATYKNVVDQMTATYIFAASGRDSLDSVISELRFLDRLLFKNLKAAGASEDEQREYRSAVYGTLGGEILWSRGFAVTRAQDRRGAGDHHRDRRATYSTVRISSRPRPPALRCQSRSRHLTKPSSPMRCDTSLRIKIFPATTASSSPGHSCARLTHSTWSSELYVASLPLVVEANLRAENGVDLNWDAVEWVRGVSEIRGFTADPSVSNRLAVKTRHAWEGRLLDALCLARRG